MVYYSHFNVDISHGAYLWGSNQMTHEFGIFNVIAGIVGAWVVGVELKRKKIGELHAPFGWLFPVMVFAFMGGKLAGIFDQLPEFRADPWGYLFNLGGHAFYGTLSFGLIALAVVARINRIPFRPFLDCLSPAIMLGYGIGKIGCQVSGDGCYGKASSLPWAMSYPNGLVPTLEKVHPAPLYESLAALVIFWIVWRLRKRGLKDGVVFGIILVLYGIERFLVEFVRRNPCFWLFSQAQWISIGVVLFGGVLIWLFQVRRN